MRLLSALPYFCTQPAGITQHIGTECQPSLPANLLDQHVPTRTPPVTSNAASQDCSCRKFQCDSWVPCTPAALISEQCASPNSQRQQLTVQPASACNAQHHGHSCSRQHQNQSSCSHPTLTSPMQTLPAVPRNKPMQATSQTEPAAATAAC
jgi:hypothetical protein